jgi:hypothetical protein
MAKEVKADEKTSELEKALDESLNELQKAAGDDTLSKSKKDDEDESAKGDKKPPFLKKKDEDKDEDEPKKEDEDAKGDEKKKDDDESAKGDKKDEEDEDEKAMKGGYRKSVEETLTKSASVANAVEVSKFLREIVKSLADINGELIHRVRRLEKSQTAFHAALAKSQGAQNDMLKSFGEQVEQIGGRPAARKSVDGRTISTLEKGFRNDEKKSEGQDLTKSEVASKIADLEMSNKVPMGTTSKYEMTGVMSKSVESMVLGESKA